MFRFRFQSLLQLRIAQRDETLAALAEAVGALQKIQQQRQSLAQQRQAVLVDPNIARLGQLRVDELLAQGRYERQLALEHARLAQLQSQIEAEIQRRQDAVRAAEIEVRRLEMLQQRDRDAWLAKDAKQQQAMMDELAARRHQASATNAWPDPTPERS